MRLVPLQPERLGEITPDLVLQAMTPRTRLVALASCHFLSGYRLDYETIGEECTRRGVLFCLDAIQSLGATPIDVRHVDFLAADSHKWMLGPLGAGIFYVKRKHFATLRPSLVGAWNVRSPGFIAQPEVAFEETARRYEPGALNMLALFGMKASLELILGLGVKQIEARLLDLRSFAEDRLLERGLSRAGPRQPAVAEIGHHHRGARRRRQGPRHLPPPARGGHRCLPAPEPRGGPVPAAFAPLLQPGRRDRRSREIPLVIAPVSCRLALP